jgi:glyoxylase-like metal-dependent hydrolase (beta-lactamase superfamily II)
MEIKTLNAGSLLLDGGAMYGVVPKPLWQKLNPPDALNRCTWAMRCLLVEANNRLIVVDTGLGNKQNDKFFSHYVPDRQPGNGIVTALRQAGYDVPDITDVLLTHLHFDHVGGAVERVGGSFQPVFPNATYWTHSEHWAWATNPNPREKASFLAENIEPLQASGQLRFMNETPPDVPGLELIYVDGHTEKMALPKLTVGGQTYLYCADLIPSSGHVPLPYVMSYDVRPLLTMEEKERLLTQAAAEGWVLIFEHDPAVAAATVVQTDRGVRLGDQVML